jgi:ketosteroid isomerase-like protein
MSKFAKTAVLASALLVSAPAVAETSEDNIKVVQDFFAAYGAGDMAGIAAVMDADVRWHIPGRHPLSGTKNGRDEVMAFFNQLGTAGFKAEPIYFGADETHVVDIHRGWSNVEGAENADTVWALVYRIEGGKIVEATNLSGDQDAANSFFWSQYDLAPVPARLAGSDQ